MAKTRAKAKAKAETRAKVKPRRKRGGIPMPAYPPFTACLRRLVEEHEWTQAAIAEAVEVSRQSLVGWVGGHSEPRMASLVRLCTFFGVSADAILDR